MSELDSSNQLFVLITKNDLFTKLVAQLNKDFRFAGLADEFSDTIDPKELRPQLTSVVFRLINNNFTDYLNLLYRIDISETQIKNLDGSDIEKWQARFPN